MMTLFQKRNAKRATTVSVSRLGDRFWRVFHVLLLSGCIYALWSYTSSNPKVQAEGNAASAGIVIEFKSTGCESFPGEMVETIALKPYNDVRFESFLEGPGLYNQNVSADGVRPAVACKFQRDNYTDHYPYAMQQLLRCASWYTAHPNHDHFLVMKAPTIGHFLAGFVQNLRLALGIRWVRFKGPLPVVRPKVDYGYPTTPQERATLPNIGFQTHAVSDLKTLRDRILQHLDDGADSEQSLHRAGCPRDSIPSSRPMPVIGLLNRRSDKGRSVQNVNDLRDALQEKLNVKVNLVYFEESDFEAQVRFMSQTDILLSPHGDQLSSIFFLPDCASVLEFFPTGFHFPDYYASLANAAGLSSYQSLYTGRNKLNETDHGMQSEATQNLARQNLICVHVDTVVEHTRKLVAEWQACCDQV